MIITHKDNTPKIDPSAYIAPNATLCGDVVVGAGSRIMFGAYRAGLACASIILTKKVKNRTGGSIVLIESSFTDAGFIVWENTDNPEKTPIISAEINLFIGTSLLTL